MNLNTFLQLFSYDPKLDSTIIETDDRVEGQFKLGMIKIPEEIGLVDALKSFPIRDSLTLNYSVGKLPPVTLRSNPRNVSDFLIGVDSRLSQRETSEDVSIHITIAKTSAQNTLSIYCYNEFISYLNSLDIEPLVDFFQRKLCRERFCFHLFDREGYVHSPVFSFTNNPKLATKIIQSVSQDQRIKRQTAMVSGCHFSGSATFTLLPDDFDIVDQDGNIQDIKLFMDRLCVIFCLVYIADISQFKNSSVFFKINGYKAISTTINFNLAPLVSLAEYLKIYNWIYDDGNLFDKLGLTRNIVSLHLSMPERLILNGNVFESIKSAHKIYLENNIKQYIDIRNKISDQLLEFNKRAVSIVDTYAGNFQKSVFTFLTFLVSMILLRLANKEGEISISGSAAILCIGLFISVIIYLYYSLWELDEQKRRFERSYENMKLRYEDLLDPKDIARILRNDSDFKQDLAFINDKRKRYTFMWEVVMAIFALLLVLLYFKKIFIVGFQFVRFVLNHCIC